MKVPMADLAAQYQSMKKEIDGAVGDVLANCRFILGDNVITLEKEIADYCGAKYGLGVNSGTDALLLSLAALGVGPGNEVITTPFTFVATTEAIALLGATPVYADIDLDTYCLDPEKIEAKITPRTKAILPVHLYGRAAEIARILEIAGKHNLKVVWDGAQAIGVESGGKPVGAYGDAVTLSFFPTKNLGGAGDGGMILLNDPELVEKVKLLRFHGSGGTYSYKMVGYCSRLDELQAAILRVKLPHLDAWTEARRGNAEAYRRLLSDLPIIFPQEDPTGRHAYHQFTIRCSERDALREHLGSNDVSSGIYYPNPLHLETAYAHLGYSPGDLPEAERACREVLSLPVFPEMSAEQLAHVAASVRSFYER
ncbi:MAG: DegT/DnrJ/EryC1/StrS family aminotransferase [Armatimonadota bacterium]